MMRDPSAILDDETPSPTSPGAIGMLLLLICAAGAVSFLVLALICERSLQGLQAFGPGYVDELQRLHAAMVAANGDLGGTDDTKDAPVGLAAGTSAGEDEYSKAAEAYEALASSYSDILKERDQLRDTLGPNADQSGGLAQTDVERDRLRLVEETLLSEIRDLERNARLGASGATRAIHAELRGDGCFVFPDRRRLPCDGLGQALLERAFREHVDLVVLWVRPGSVEPYHATYETLMDAGVRVSHEPLPFGESVEAILTGLRDE